MTLLTAALLGRLLASSSHPSPAVTEEQVSFPCMTLTGHKGTQVPGPDAPCPEDVVPRQTGLRPGLSVSRGGGASSRSSLCPESGAEGRAPKETGAALPQGGATDMVPKHLGPRHGALHCACCPASTRPPAPGEKHSDPSAT